MHESWECMNSCMILKFMHDSWIQSHVLIYKEKLQLEFRKNEKIDQQN